MEASISRDYTMRSPVTRCQQPMLERVIRSRCRVCLAVETSVRRDSTMSSPVTGCQQPMMERVIRSR